MSIAIGESFMQLRSVLKMMMVLDRQMENMSLTHVFRQIEMPITFLLAQMEFNGICISRALLDQTSLSVKRQIATVTEQVTFRTGETLNLASSDQVAALLFDTLGLPSSLSTTTAAGHGSPNGSSNAHRSTSTTGKRPRHASTAEEDLLQIRTLHPVVDLVLTFRGLSKFLSTYVEGLRPFIISFPPGELFLRPVEMSNGMAGTEGFTPYEVIMINQTTHSGGTVTTSQSHKISSSSDLAATKIHCVWNQTVVRTGRLSCCRPNLQSAPNTQKLENGFELNCREFFVASTGYV